MSWVIEFGDDRYYLSILSKDGDAVLAAYRDRAKVFKSREEAEEALRLTMENIRPAVRKKKDGR